MRNKSGFLATGSDEALHTGSFFSSKCLSMDDWIKEIWYTHTIEYQHQKKEILSFARTWMKLEGIIPKESQTEKAKHCIVSLVGGIKKK